MKVLSSLFSYLGAGVTRLKAEISAIYASLVTKVSSIWNRHPTEPAKSSGSLQGKTVTVNPESVVVSDEIVQLAARHRVTDSCPSTYKDLDRAAQGLAELLKLYSPSY